MKHKCPKCNHESDICKHTNAKLKRVSNDDKRYKRWAKKNSRKEYQHKYYQENKKRGDGL